MQSGLVKSCHHAVFDECWFHQAWRLPAAQLLYDLGTAVSNAHPDIPHPTATSMPSSASDNDGIIVSIPSKTATPTPLNVLPPPHQIPIDDDSSTSSSTTSLIADVGPTRALTVNVPTQNTDASVVDHYGITGRDLEQVYFSQHHYGHAFEECFAYSGSPTTIYPMPAWNYVNSTVESSLLTSPSEPHVPRYLVGNQDSAMSASSWFMTLPSLRLPRLSLL
jgi:hypothetical protein